MGMELVSPAFIYKGHSWKHFCNVLKNDSFDNDYCCDNMKIAKFNQSCSQN